MNNFKEVKLDKGQFKGKTVVFETSGITKDVVCQKCDWASWQTFFIRDFTEKDIHRKYPKCESILKFKEKVDD